jgi:hypothetical protein
VRIALFLIIVGFFVAARAEKLDCGPLPNPKPDVEWKQVPSQNIYSLDVTFIGKAPSTAQVDKILRQCAAAAAKRGPSKEFLVSGWLRKRPHDNPNDDDLLHPYGSLKYLSYDPKSKSVGVHDMKLEKR